jgi:hypothetical protein
MSLLVYRELTVEGSEVTLEDFEKRLESNLGEGWSRDRDNEARLHDEQACFEHVDSEHKVWDLWLARSAGKLWCSNIIRADGSRVSVEEYNVLLTDFYKRFVRFAAQHSGAAAEMTTAQVELEDLMSARTAKLLRGFSAAANRSSLHPLDERRLEEFLVAAHDEELKFDVTMFKRWLVEEEKWPEEAVSTLGMRYEDGRSLLKTYERCHAALDS